MNSSTEDPNVLKDNSAHSQVGFTCEKITQSLDAKNSELKSRSSLSGSFESNLNFQSKQTYSSSETPCSYNSYACETQASTKFSSAASNRNNDSFSAIASISQTGYKSSFCQSNMVTFDATSTSADTSDTFIKTSSPSQVRKTKSFSKFNFVVMRGKPCSLKRKGTN